MTHEPADPNHIYVFHDGVPVPDNDGTDTFWHYDASSNSIIFDKVPSAQVLVEIAYYYEEGEQDTEVNYLYSRYLYEVNFRKQKKSIQHYQRRKR